MFPALFCHVDSLLSNSVSLSSDAFASNGYSYFLEVENAFFWRTEDGDDQRTKLRKWMEEKKRRDMEERQKNREKQQQQQQPPNRSTKKPFAKKNDRLTTRNGVTTGGKTRYAIAPLRAKLSLCAESTSFPY